MSKETAIDQAELEKSYRLSRAIVREAGVFGAWDNEPNRYETKHLGFDILLVRHHTLLHWCGYVGVKNSHPAFGKDYDDIDASVHGGLTYSDACHGAVCHNSSDETWWFGFDCAHCDDISPATHIYYDRSYGVFEKLHYWTMDEVLRECKDLAEQLKNYVARNDNSDLAS